MGTSHALAVSIYDEIISVLEGLLDGDGDAYFVQVLKGKHAAITRFPYCVIMPEQVTFVSDRFKARFATRIFSLLIGARTSNQESTLNRLEELSWEVYDCFMEIDQGAGETDYSALTNRSLGGLVYWVEVDDFTPTYNEEGTFIEGESLLTLRVQYDIE